MSTPQTTIKVPKDLRNRIAAQAEAQHVTFATAIERALDAAEDRAFWEAITRHNAALTQADHEKHLVDHTISDDLADVDDDHLTETNRW